MATSAPRLTIFLTVSGVAATRGSPASISSGMAIFMMPPRGCRTGATGRRGSGSDEEIGHQDEQDDDERNARLGQRQKHPIGIFMLGIVVACCGRVFDLAVVGHCSPPNSWCVGAYRNWPDRATKTGERPCVMERLSFVMRRLTRASTS